MKFVYAISVMALSATMAQGGIVMTTPFAGGTEDNRSSGSYADPLRGPWGGEQPYSRYGARISLFDDFTTPPAIERDLPVSVYPMREKEPFSEIDLLLEGRINIDWSGEHRPFGDRGRYPLEMDQIPEPASMLMIILVSVTGLFIRRRFR